MQKHTITIDQGLLFSAFLIAILIRFIKLGQIPLTDNEANLALQALELGRGKLNIIDLQPGYILFTSALFFLFAQGSEFLARFWPALIGSLLVLTPYLFRDRLGRTTAIILAFGLAIDPGLVAASRQAGGLSMAISFTILGLGFLNSRKTILTGLMLGLALLCGPSVWQGLIILILTFLWSWLIKKSVQEEEETYHPDKIEKASQIGFPWKSIFIWAVFTLLAVGSGFWFVPGGLSGFTSSLQGFLQGWISTQGVPISLLLIALLAYELFALIFGVWAIGWGVIHNKDSVDQFVSRWWLIAAFFVLIYPGRQIQDLTWVIIPLWVLAARQLQRLYSKLPEEWLPALGHAAGVLVLLVFAWLNFTGITDPLNTNEANQLRLAAVIGALVLVVVITIIVMWGWSSSIGGIGLRWAAGILLLLILIASSVSAAGLGRRPSAEMWRNEPYAVDQDHLMQSIEDFSRWSEGQKNLLDIVVVDFPSASLRWALRNMRTPLFANTISSKDHPSLVITPQIKDLSTGGTYSGQDFIWKQKIIWSNLSPADWLSWLVYRRGIMEKEYIILWVRSDLFPGTKPGLD